MKAMTAEKIAKKENPTAKSIMSEISKNSLINGKIMAHNGILTTVYLAVMALIFIGACHLANVISAAMIGYYGAYDTSTIAGALVFQMCMLMTAGFCLFFAFKLENAVIRALKKRLWHRDGDAITSVHISEKETKKSNKGE